MTKFGFTKLGLHNYPAWSKQIKGLLATKGWLAALTDPADGNTVQAKGLITMCVQDCHLTLVENAANAQAAWQALANLYQQQSSANILRLKREFANLEKKREENVTEFMARVSDLSEQIQAATGNPVPETDIIVAVLSALPSQFSMIKTVIESMPVLPTLAEVQAKLLLVEADRSRGNESANYHSSNQPRPFGGEQPRVYVPPHKRNNRFGGNNSNYNRTNYNTGNRETRKCYYCGKLGHLKKDCRKLKEDNLRRSNRSSNHTTTTPAVVALSALTTQAEEDSDDYECEYPTHTKPIFDREDPTNIWFIDSGATKHITCYQNILHNHRALDQERTVTYGNDEKVTVDTYGDVILERSISPDIKLVMKDVLYSPKNAFNLLSVSAAAANGVEFVFTADRCLAYKDGELILGATKHSNGLYKLLSPPVYPRQPVGDYTLATTQTNDKDPLLWHRRLGHIGYSSLKRLVESGMVKGLPLSAEDIDKAKEICDTCMKTKSTRQPFKPSESKTDATLDLIHMDLCGPLEESIGKSKYIATFLDDYSGYSAVVLLKQKSDTYNAIRDTFSMFETQTERRIKAARSDNGGEYMSNILREYFKEKGIDHQTTMAYSPQSNGKAERLNRTLMEKTRAMLSEANLPESLWGEAITTANYLRNRSPTANKDRTPWELFFGKKPDLSNLRPFGCEAFVHIPKKKRSKLGDTAEKGIMVGYMPNGYRILLDDNTVQTSRDVVFNETDTLTHRSTNKEEPQPQEDTDDDDEMPSLYTESESEDEDDDGPDDNDNGGGNGGGLPAPGPSPAPAPASAPGPSSNPRISSRTNRGVPAARYGYDQIFKAGIITISEPETLEEAKTKTTPLSPAIKLSKSEGEPLDKETFPYGTLVGKLMFLTVATRPDIAYTVGTLARFISNPNITHWQAAKGVVRYLAYTKNKGITFRGSDLTLTGYCDADYAGDLDTRKSTTGYVFINNGGAISWNSKRQPTVAVSTTEAEYMAAASATKEGLWLRKLFHSLDMPLTTIDINCDNQSAIKLLRNPIFSVRSKHIDVVHHFARERVQRKEVAFHYIPTSEMAADVMTKVLPASKHEVCCDMMGMA